MEKNTKHISTFLTDIDVKKFQCIQNHYSNKINVSVSAIVKMLIREEYNRLNSNNVNSML